MMNAKVGDIRGAYQIQIIEKGEVIFDTGEFSNLIMNAAADYGDPFNTGYLLIGTGDTPPTVSDTALQSQAGQTAATFASLGTIAVDDNIRYGKRSVTASFTGIEANIREVGFKNGSDVLLSRCLVRDGNDNLTMIPLSSFQTLKITFFTYTQILDEMASGTLTTSYGDTTDYTVKPSGALSDPRGIFIGKFNNPFGSTAAGAMKMLLSPSGSVTSSSFSAVYNTETQTCSVTVNFAATATNREIIGFEAATNPDSYAVIEFSESITLPADSDITLTLDMSWS